jgi:hypothetical protein
MSKRRTKKNSLSGFVFERTLLRNPAVLLPQHTNFASPKSILVRGFVGEGGINPHVVGVE